MNSLGFLSSVRNLIQIRILSVGQCRPDFNLIFRWSFLFLFWTDAHNVRENNTNRKLQAFCLVLITCYVGIFPFLITSDNMKTVMALFFLESFPRLFFDTLFFRTFFRIFNLTHMLSKVLEVCPDILRQKLRHAFSFCPVIVFVYWVFSV